MRFKKRFGPKKQVEDQKDAIESVINQKRQLKIKLMTQRNGLAQQVKCHSPAAQKSQGISNSDTYHEDG